MNNQNLTLQSTMEKRLSLANELCLKGKSCDAVIKVGNVKFHVHKVVLCVRDPFFSDLFFDSSDTKRTEFTIDAVSHEIMSQIIDFAYTGSVSLTNIYELMIAANQLNIKSLGETCSDILLDQLCPENCIEVWHFTNTNHSCELQCEAFDFICGHFEEVALCEGFLQLSVQELTDILGRDDLNVFPESTVYESVLRWINHRPEEREGTIATLLSKVRLGMMDMDYFRNNVANNVLVKTNSDSNLMVGQVTGSHYMINNPLFQPRLPNAILVAIGGRSDYRHSDNIIEAYNYWTNSWITLPIESSMPVVRYTSTVFLDGSIYIVGGDFLKSMLKSSNSVYKFDLERHTSWKQVGSMHERRGHLSVTVLDGCIYAMGGFDGGHSLTSAEYYDPNIKEWTLIASMNDGRSHASCTTLNDKIYVCGGRNRSRYLRTAECYDPDTDQWTLIAPMGTRRWALGVVAYVDHIFAVGGIDEIFNSLKSVEAYNPVTNTWYDVPDMIHSRIFFGIAVINKRLFVVSDSSKVECYDSRTGSWSKVCSMEMKTTGLSCCVISGLSNMADYCSPLDASFVETDEEYTSSEDLV